MQLTALEVEMQRRLLGSPHRTELERVAAEVLTIVPKKQHVVAVMREPGRGYDNPPVGSGCQG